MCKLLRFSFLSIFKRKWWGGFREIFPRKIGSHRFGLSFAQIDPVWEFFQNLLIFLPKIFWALFEAQVQQQMIFYMKFKESLKILPKYFNFELFWVFVAPLSDFKSLLKLKFSIFFLRSIFDLFYTKSVKKLKFEIL